MRFTRCLLSTWRATVQECRAAIQSDLNLTLFALLTYDYLTADNSFCNTRRARSRNLSLISVHHRGSTSRRIIWDDDCRVMRLLREEKKARINSSAFDRRIRESDILRNSSARCDFIPRIDLPSGELVIIFLSLGFNDTANSSITRQKRILLKWCIQQDYFVSLEIFPRQHFLSISFDAPISVGIPSIPSRNFPLLSNLNFVSDICFNIFNRISSFETI